MLVVVMAAVLGACQTSGSSKAQRLPLDDLVLRRGFHVDVYAIVPGAASLVIQPDGIVNVATTRGEVVRLEDHDRDGIADEATRLDVMLEPPVVLARADDGSVLAMTGDQVVALGADGTKPIVPRGVLPQPRAGSRHHLTSGPDGRLYVSLGQPCVGCRGRSLAASILDMRPDGHGLRVHARAILRPGALAWHPRTAELAFTDQAPGRIAREGAISALFRLDERPIHGLEGIATIGLVENDDWVHVVPELKWTFPRGLEPAGMAYYEGEQFPMTLRDALLVALHPVGDSEAPARVVAVRFGLDGRPLGEDVLLTGWRSRDGDVWGRPIDLEPHPDGSVLIADDVAGVIYRLSYRG